MHTARTKSKNRHDNCVGRRLNSTILLAEEQRRKRIEKKEEIKKNDSQMFRS